MPTCSANGGARGVAVCHECRVAHLQVGPVPGCQALLVQSMTEKCRWAWSFEKDVPCHFCPCPRYWTVGKSQANPFPSFQDRMQRSGPHEK
eukprot:1158939-Pelagomonas_calceolata.AAC.7